MAMSDAVVLVAYVMAGLLSSIAAQVKILYYSRRELRHRKFVRTRASKDISGMFSATIVILQISSSIG